MPTLHRRGALAAALALGLALSAPGPAAAQDGYPSEPIRLVVPHGAGGGTDVFTRLVAAPTAQNMGASIAVVNVTGGGTAIGAQEVARSEPDGHTLLSTHVALLTSSAMGANQMGPDSLDPIAQLGEEVNVVAVRADSPLTTVADFFEAVGPGGTNPKLGISAGAGNHFAFLQMLQAVDDPQVTFVPVGGGGPSMTALLGGNIDVGTFTVSEVIDQLAAGEIRVLSVFGAERHPDLPDVPTATEEGFPVEIGLHYVWYAPAGTPPERIAVVADALEATISDEAFQEEMLSRSIEPAFLRGEALEEALDERWETIQAIAASMG